MNNKDMPKAQRQADLEKSIDDIIHLIGQYENQLVTPANPEQELNANRRLDELNQLLAVQEEKLERLKSPDAKISTGRLQIPETANHEIQRKLEEIKDEVTRSVDRLMLGQEAIGHFLSETRNQELQSIIQLLHDGSIQQEDMKNALDIILQAVAILQPSQHKISSEIENSLRGASLALDSDLNLQGKLELTLPIIPLLLDYKVEVAAANIIDLNKMWEDLKRKWRKQTRQTDDNEFDASLNSGANAILFKIEHSDYNAELSAENKNFLKSLFAQIKQPEHVGEIAMNINNITVAQAADVFIQTSRSVAYFLSSLAEYHSKWSKLILADRNTEQSMQLLEAIQDQILLASSLIEQFSAPQDFHVYEYETQNVLNSVNQLQRLLDDINQFLISGNIPPDISLQMERLFDDLVFYATKYLIVVNDLAGSIKKQKPYLQ